MRSILHDQSIRFAGAQEVRRTEHGLLPMRVPAWAVAQIHDPAFRFTASAASGVRLAFSSDTQTLELDAMLRGIEMEGMALSVPRFDLVVDGNTVAKVTSTDGGRWMVSASMGGDRTPSLSFREGPESRLRFADLGVGMKRIEVWFPQTCTIEVRDVRIDDGARIEASPLAGPRWVHYGSSISQCGEADGPTETWPAVASRLASVDLTSLGFGGQCQLDQCVARTIRDLPADAISLKLGVNVVNGDTMRERVFVPALHGFLDMVRDGHPNTPILVVTPILYPAAEDHPGPSISRDGQSAVVDRPVDLEFGALSIGRIRKLIADVVERRQAAGDANLYLLDGRELFGADDVADLPDGLHPNTAGYRRMGERFAALAFGQGGALAAR